MSLIYNKEFNYNGSSQTTPKNEGEMATVIITMSANYRSDGSISFYKNVNNVDLYNANKEMADADYAEFESNVYASICAPEEAVSTK